MSFRCLEARIGPAVNVAEPPEPRSEDEMCMLVAEAEEPSLESLREWCDPEIAKGELCCINEPAMMLGGEVAMMWFCMGFI